MIGSIDEAKQQMSRAMEHLDTELNKIRTGRANASILEGVKIRVYGQETPLMHAANVNALDAQTLQITPFDPNNLEAISAAIREDQSLGLNPADDGRVVRIPIPPMTEDRRREVVKQVSEKAEEARISLRNVRHELLKAVKQQEKDKEISRDDYADTEKAIAEHMDELHKIIEEASATKEQEIMTV